MTTSKVHIWHTGQVNTDRAMAFKEKTLHPLPNTGWLRPKSKRIWMPVSVYLIEHPKGLILVDTGWHEEMRTNQKKHLGWFAYSMLQGSLPEGESVRERLETLGLKAEDLDYVLLTHLHSDHVSGLEQVKEAKRILATDLEWKDANSQLGYVKSMWAGVNIETYAPEKIPFGPYNLGLDLFGDGSFYLVHTPGHTNGQFSVLIKTSNGWTLLASDVGYAEKSWKELILPGTTINKDEALRSLEWVAQFAQRDDCHKVVVNHDSNIQPQIIE